MPLFNAVYLALFSEDDTDQVSELQSPQVLLGLQRAQLEAAPSTPAGLAGRWSNTGLSGSELESEGDTDFERLRPGSLSRGCNDTEFKQHLGRLSDVQTLACRALKAIPAR